MAEYTDGPGRHRLGWRQSGPAVKSDYGRDRRWCARCGLQGMVETCRQAELVTSERIGSGARKLQELGLTPTPPFSSSSASAVRGPPREEGKRGAREQTTDWVSVNAAARTRSPEGICQRTMPGTDNGCMRRTVTSRVANQEQNGSGRHFSSLGGKRSSRLLTTASGVRGHTSCFFTVSQFQAAPYVTLFALAGGGRTP